MKVLSDAKMLFKVLKLVVAVCLFLFKIVVGERVTLGSVQSRIAIVYIFSTYVMSFLPFDL